MEISPEFLESALASLKQEICSSLHVAMPGTLQSYNAQRRTAVIQPVLLRQNAAGDPVTAPLLYDVPVFSCNPSVDPSPGAPCFLIFADFCMDGFLETGQPTLPLSPRTHDLSDAVALVR